MKFITPSRFLNSLIAFLALAAGGSAQTILFSVDFDGGTGDLNATTPDTGSVNWVATPTNFLADGTIGGSGAGTAMLAFTPTNGLVYTLDASFRGVTGDQNWIPFGFVNGQGTSSSPSGANENRFLEHQTVGIAWMFARGDNSTNPNRAFLGDDVANNGLSDGADWSGGPTNGGDIDMRIVLDTTGGSGTWTATWFAKRPADPGYTEIRATATLISEAITSVGFGESNTGVSGTIASFSLSFTDGLPAIPAITSIEVNDVGDVILTLDGPAEGLTVQRSNDLSDSDFGEVASTADGNTLTIAAADVDPNEDGTDFFRVSS